MQRPEATGRDQPGGGYRDPDPVCLGHDAGGESPGRQGAPGYATTVFATAQIYRYNFRARMKTTPLGYRLAFTS